MMASLRHHLLPAAGLALVLLQLGPRPSVPSLPSVVLGALEVPADLEQPDAVRAAFEPLVIRALEAAGFSVIPSSEADPVWEKHRREFSPYFDPVSGEEYRDRTRAARRAAIAELAATRGAIAWILPALVKRAAPYERGKASWDGASEGAAPTGAGEVTGASIALRLVDRTGEMAGTGYGGIQLLTKFSQWNSKFTVVARKKLFQDGKKNRAAVDHSLSPLLEVLRRQPVPFHSVETAPSAQMAAPAAPTPIWPVLEAGAHAVLLRDMRVPNEEVEIPEAIRDRYLDLLIGRLRSSGWTVIEPAVFEAAYRAAALRAGGLFDPSTGAPVQGRADSALAETRRQVAAHLPGALVLSPVIAVVPAPFRNEKASWHGVSESVAGVSALTKLLVTSSGRTEALSFGVFLEDLSGRDLHSGMGGIQLLSTLEGSRFVRVSRESLFADPGRDERAVDLAFSGFPRP